MEDFNKEIRTHPSCGRSTYERGKRSPPPLTAVTSVQISLILDPDGVGQVEDQTDRIIVCDDHDQVAWVRRLTVLGPPGKDTTSISHQGTRYYVCYCGAVQNCEGRSGPAWTRYVKSIDQAHDRPVKSEITSRSGHLNQHQHGERSIAKSATAFLTGNILPAVQRLKSDVRPPESATRSGYLRGG